MTEEGFSRPAPLDRSHQLDPFDCGKPPLNEFLTKYALANQAGGGARTYVVLSNAKQVLAYYSLAPSAVAVPVILMARLAVDKSAQGKGLGRTLLFDALGRALHGSEEIGGRAFFVEAKDEDAAAFYRKFGMEPSLSDPLHLLLLFKDVRRTLGVCDLLLPRRAGPVVVYSSEKFAGFLTRV